MPMEWREEDADEYIAGVISGLTVNGCLSLENGRPRAAAHNKKHDKQDQTDHKQDPRDVGGHAGNAAKAQQGGDDGND
jgi:hypothetical protein